MQGSRGFCYDNKTEVLTKYGWKHFSEVTLADEIATLNNGMFIEYQKPTNIIRESRLGKMYKLKSTMVDLVVTPNHKMFVKKVDTQKARRGEQDWELLSAEDIFNKRVRYKKNAKWNGNHSQTFKLPDLGRIHGSGRLVQEGKSFSMNTFLRFLGYFISEGNLDHTEGGSYGVVISQNEGTIYDDIISTIQDMGYKYQIKQLKTSNSKQIRICDMNLYHFLKYTCGDSCYHKRLPHFVKELTIGQIREFIRAAVSGDGNIHKDNDHEVYYTTSKRLADDFQELYLKIGLSASIRS